ncbi:unnamed protein product, partial [Iphiclides podalirius]
MALYLPQPSNSYGRVVHSRPEGSFVALPRPFAARSEAIRNSRQYNRGQKRSRAGTQCQVGALGIDESVSRHKIRVYVQSLRKAI